MFVLFIYYVVFDGACFTQKIHNIMTQIAMWRKSKINKQSKCEILAKITQFRLSSYLISSEWIFSANVLKRTVDVI